jgi:hypothetical protein
MKPNRMCPFTVSRQALDDAATMPVTRCGMYRLQTVNETPTGLRMCPHMERA